MVHYLVISGSLSPESRSRVLARTALQKLIDSGQETEWIDLQEWQLPQCDGGPCYEHPQTIRMTEKIMQADGILLAAPVYNFDLNAAVKNLVELSTGDAWRDKVVGFLCAAGGRSSYMAVMGLANSLMLDFRAFVIPRFVYAVGEDFAAVVQERVGELVEKLIVMTEAIEKIR